MRDAFSDCHPTVNCIFYIGAFVMGMCFIHPLFLACSLVCALGYFVLMNKERMKFLLGMVILGSLLSFVNPLFNTQGEHVLFTYFGGRPYTFEALCYGIALAAMFVTILTWFATYNRVMTSDKFLYCFGRLAPAMSLILTMVLRLVPSFQKKAEQITAARRCIGKGADYGSKQEKAEQGMVILSALTSWALEGGVVLSDSMKSRGFGAGKRTSFSIYPMRVTDRRILILIGALSTAVLLCACKGGMAVEYTPQLNIPGTDCLWTVAGGICYFAFLSIPTTMHILEELTWRILKSKI